MDKAEREALANELIVMADADYDFLGRSDSYYQGVEYGLRMAACHIRDNHPKEEDEK